MIKYKNDGSAEVPESALEVACRLAEELRESDAAEYSRTEQAIMALYFEARRLRAAGGLMRAWIGSNEKTITERWDALRPNNQGQPRPPDSGNLST